MTAHDSRSDRFRPIPTIEILRGLAKEGFSPVGAVQSTSRDATRREFTKHLIRMRRLDDARKHSVGGTVCEMLIKNANDGTSGYDLMAGLFRIQCLNSLVSKTADIDSVKVRHTGDVMAKVIEGTYRVLGEAEKVLAAPQDWSQINLNRDAGLALAEAAHVLRFGVGKDDGQTVATPTTAVHPEQMIIPRRMADNGTDLWSRWNVIQENALRGGLTAMGRDANGRPRWTTTREIKGIDQNVRLNQALWVLGERMAGILKAAA